METITGFNAGSIVFLDESCHLYTKNKTVDGRVYVKCYFQSCKARAIIDGNEYNLKQAHDNHEKPHDKIAILKFRNQIRLDAESNPDKTARAIFDNAQRQHPEAALLVGFSSVESLIGKSRKKSCPPIPKDLENLAAYLNDEK